MRIHVTGLNHEAAPVHVREKLAFPRHRLPEALEELCRVEGVAEAVILSTCNRVEVYVCTNGPPGDALVSDFLASFHGVWPETFAPYLYGHDDVEAVAHLFRVASGLDSMVLGEAQITGQVREAYEAASEGAGPVLHRLFQHALSVAKQVRTHTDIGQGRASVGSVAVELAERIFESLADRVVLVVGAGEMGASVVRALRAAGSETTLVANRTYTRAEELASEWGGSAVRYDALPAHLAQADIVISSTDAPHYVIRPEDVAAAVRSRPDRSLFLIDIAVPRDIDPAAGDVDGCYLYNVDDLQAVVAETLTRRNKELGRCQAIVAAECDKFVRWLGHLTVAPTIGELSATLHAIKDAELGALGNRLPDLSEKDRQEIERMADRLVNKILHQPIQALRESSAGERHEGFLTAVLHLFGLGRD